MAQDALSQAQFYRQVAEKTLSEGGSTQHLVTGHVPDQGYMVSDVDREHVVPASGFNSAKVAQYADRHREALEQPDAYLGTWRASRENAAGAPVRVPSDKVYTDTSRRYPTAEDALQGMEQNKQLATYVLHTGREHSLDEMRRALQTTEPDPKRGR